MFVRLSATKVPICEGCKIRWKVLVREAVNPQSAICEGCKIRWKVLVREGSQPAKCLFVRGSTPQNAHL